jgi:glyoxylase-like metal-dependent hydrolase (beta-lactamase superfamily II)
MKPSVFVGDTLFLPDVGSARADFPGGDAPQLYHSMRRLLELPPQRIPLNALPVQGPSVEMQATRD